MSPDDIYNNLNENYSEFLMDETMDLTMDHDASTESKLIAEKLIKRAEEEVDFDNLDFTKEELEQNKERVIEIFAEMIVEMNEF